MNIAIYNHQGGGGIVQAGKYLNDYLNNYHKSELILWDHYGDPTEFFINRIKNKSIDRIIIHDFNKFDIKKFKQNFNIPTFYFVPGKLTYNNPDIYNYYDYTLCPSETFYPDNWSVKAPHIKWTFDIKKPEKLKPFSKRLNRLLYVGRVISAKFDPMFLALALRSNIKIDIVGSMGEKDSEEEELLFELMKHPNVNYLGSFDHEDMLEIYQQYKYYILPSNDDIFSLSALEAIYNGCLPFVKRRHILDYPWFVDSTKKFYNNEDLIGSILQTLSIPDKINDEICNFHRESVLSKMSMLSDINIINNL
ncbi:MAG: glycosyltransferase [Thiohalospira sp.]